MPCSSIMLRVKDFLIVFITLVVSVVAQLPNNTACGKQYYAPHVSKRIVGGKEVLANSWPWMAALKFDGILTCGGTLIRNNNGSYVVLTAAHCVDGSLLDESRWEVRLGFNSRTNAQYEPYYEIFNVSKIIQHPNFTIYDIQNDIAVMILDGPVLENDGVTTACVTREMYGNGENCVSLGWGTTEQGGLLSDRLQEVYKPLLNTSSCLRYLGGLYDGTTMLCAGFEAGGAGPCYKDSGGPLLCRRNDQWYLTGIISWGFGCGQPNAPPVYTNVYQYVSSGWLREAAAI